MAARPMQGAVFRPQGSASTFAGRTFSSCRLRFRGLRGIGHDVDPLGRNPPFTTVKRILQQCLRPSERQQLFRQSPPALRPESCPASPGHDHGDR